MTQEIIMRQTELTVAGINPTLNKEVNIFMLDGGIHTEGIVVNRGPITRPVELPSLPVVNGMSLEGLTPAQQADARRTMQIMDSLGLKPDQVTSKGRTEQTAQEVVENSLLDSQDPAVVTRSRDLIEKEGILEDEFKDERKELFGLNSGRLSAAESLLKESLLKKGREKLTDAEKVAILKAHFLGDKGVYEVDRYQLRAKVKILMDVGFDEDQRRQILESGLSAFSSSDRVSIYNRDLNLFINTLNVTSATPAFTDTVLQGIRQQLIDYNAERATDFQAALASPVDRRPNPKGLNFAFLKKLGEQLDEYAVTNGPSSSEYVSLREAVVKISEYSYMIYQGGAAFEEGFDELARDPANRALLKEYVKEHVASINPSETGIPGSVLRRIVMANDNDSLEHLVFRIIGVPLQSETGEYGLDFYGGINLGAIKNLLQTLSENKSLEPDAHTRKFRKAQLANVVNLEKAVRRIHELNMLIVTNQLDAAKGQAPNLLQEHLQVLQKTKGVSTLMRFMEAGYLELLSKDGYIKIENHRAMMGTTKESDSGRHEVYQPHSLSSQMEAFVEKLQDIPATGTTPAIVNPLRTGSLEVFKGMEEWELDLAFNLARNMYNVLHRSAELASWGRVPGGLEAYASTVFGGFRNIFNPANYVLERFKPGENRGGYRVFQMFMDNMQRRRGFEGYGKMRLEKIKGDQIKLFELPTIAGIRGYLSSWKANEGLLKQTMSVYEPRGLATGHDVYYQGKKIYDAATNSTIPPGQIGIGYLLDTGAIEFRNVSTGERFKHGKKDERSKSDPLGRNNHYDELRADYFRSIFFKPGTGDHHNGPPAELRDDVRMALGTMYKTALSPKGGHHAHENHHLNVVTEEIRALIWQRAAEDNPLAILPYLHGLKYSDSLVDDAHTDPGKLETKIVDGKTKIVGKTVLPDIYDEPGWQDLHRKLTLLNELKLSRNKGARGAVPPVLGDLSYSFEQAAIDAGALSVTTVTTGTRVERVWGPGTGHPDIAFTAAEVALLKKIQYEGKLASGDMANVKYAFIPFANDFIFEEFDYDKPGPGSYERHFGDIVQINSSTGAMVEGMDRVVGITEYHQIIELTDKFMKGITAVHGDAYAKEKAEPFITALVAFFARGENAGGEGFVEEGKRTTRGKLMRYLRQQDEVNFFLQYFHKKNSIAQQFTNVEVLNLDKHQIYKIMEELAAAGLMGHDEEERYKKRFGGILPFIFKMILEGFLRSGKIGALGLGKTLMGESFKGAVQ